MGLKAELRAAIDYLYKTIKPRSISLKSGTDIFMNFISRMENEILSFPSFKNFLISRGEQLKKKGIDSRVTIAQYACSFFRNGTIILVHGCSRVVLACIEHSLKKGRQIVGVIQTESSPGRDGLNMAKSLSRYKIPVTIIPDSAVAHVLSQIGIILVGAEAVMENGGIINKIGTYQVAIIAKALNKPFYVAVESFKMTRMYPLRQTDFENPQVNVDLPEEYIDQINMGLLHVNNPMLDYTPPQYISLLFTDLGILTPSAVSDELLKLYY